MLESTGAFRGSSVGETKIYRGCFFFLLYEDLV